MTETQRLLSEYASRGSEHAFRELARRYLNLVYSTAIRLVGSNAHLAEDVTQIVFADLARKARTLPRDVMLGGWLHRHACFVASNVMRGERRRHARERQAVEMNTQQDHSPENLALLLPALDDAVNQLRAEDRMAIVLRFFEQQDLRSVGEALGSSENAAQKRVARALEALRGLLERRGVVFSTATLGSVLATQAVAAAPASLLAGVSASALAGAAAGAAATTTVFNLMTMTKVQAGVISAIAVIGVVTPIAIQSEMRLRAENESLRQHIEQSASPVLEASAAALPPPVEGLVGRPVSIDGELARLRGDLAGLRQQLAEMQTPSNLLWLSRNARAIAYAQALENGVLLSEEELQAGLPKESWTFAGYATPKAAAQSLMWALSTGHADTLLRSYSPAALEAKLDTAWKDQTPAEIAADMKLLMDGLIGYQITSQSLYAHNGTVVFRMIPLSESGKMAPINFSMVQVGDEWKCANVGLKARGRRTPGQP